jgi:hypothetical protein
MSEDFWGKCALAFCVAQLAVVVGVGVYTMILIVGGP